MKVAMSPCWLQTFINEIPSCMLFLSGWGVIPSCRNERKSRPTCSKLGNTVQSTGRGHQVQHPSQIIVQSTPQFLIVSHLVKFSSLSLANFP